MLTPVRSSTCRQESWILLSCSGDRILKVEVRENERIASLFAENFRRYLRGEELRNRVDPELLY